MPVSSLDPQALLATAAALGRVQVRAAEAEPELLGHLVTTGDHETDAVVEAHLEQVVDALRALAEEARNQALALRNVARTHHDTERTVADDLAYPTRAPRST